MLAMTTDFHEQSRKTADLKATLTRIAQAGFSHIHWCHEWIGYYEYSSHEMFQIKEWCDELWLKTKGLHASVGERNADLKNFTSSNEYNRLAGVELIKNRVDLAHILDAEAIVLHPNSYGPPLETEQDIQHYFDRAFKSFDELEGYCKTRHIKICIENTGEPVLGCRIFDKLFERYDRDFMGLCFDTGHAHLGCKENSLVYAERYNDRLFMIHTHDNHGEKDDHILPFEGGFDWEGFAKVLARSPYTFPIVIEAYEDDVTWLERAVKAGSRLTAMTEKYR